MSIKYQSLQFLSETTTDMILTSLYIYIYIYIYLGPSVLNSSLVHPEVTNVYFEQNIHSDIWYTKMTNKMQLCKIIYYSLAALHVSSDIFAHHQEHLNCTTASGITNVCLCRLVPWECWNNSSNTPMTPAGSDIRVQYQKL